jgi:hypothetical protein
MDPVELRLIVEKGKRKTRARNRRKRIDGGNRGRTRRTTTAVIATICFIHTENHHTC